MTKKLISSGSVFEKIAGYSRAVVEHGVVHVSGTTGFNYDAMTIDDDLILQTHQTFKNIETALKQAGATFDDVVRVRYLITDASYFEQIASICGHHFANARPAGTMMVVGLVDPRMKIEIEVTARLNTYPEKP